MLETFFVSLTSYNAFSAILLTDLVIDSEINNDYTDQTLAYNDDYVNDADVTDFMA